MAKCFSFVNSSWHGGRGATQIATPAPNAPRIRALASPTFNIHGLVVWVKFSNLVCGQLARRNHLGLLSEDLDPITGELWGNFPQTYSMVGLIASAMRLSQSWDSAF